MQRNKCFRCAVTNALGVGVAVDVLLLVAYLKANLPFSKALSLGQFKSISSELMQNEKYYKEILLNNPFFDSGQLFVKLSIF